MRTSWTIRFLLALALTGAAVAQESSSQESKAQKTNPEVPSTGYQVTQSIEFGGRIADFSGNRAIWNDFVNMHSGPRLIGQTLEITTPRGTGQFFDHLSLSSFGFGGDPNNVARARISKDHWYKLTGSFRRDRNFFDYNLLANPLNPTGSNPTIIINDSPHAMETIRRNSDVALTILPQSRISGRLGFNSVAHEGPFFSTVHQGTEALLFQPFRNTTHTYRGGIDIRWPRKTTISYDQIFTLNKFDTNYRLNDTNRALANGTMVDLGIPFNTGAGQPCAQPFLATGFVNPACNAYTSYQRFNRTRTFFPTEQLTITSSPFHRLDFSGRFVYSGAESDLPNALETLTGLSSRTRLAGLVAGGPVYNKRVSVTSDIGVTVHFTDQLRLSDTFRWSDFRIPGHWVDNESALVSASLLISPNVYSPATCATVNAPGCPQHNTSSPADLILHDFSRFLGQDSKTNTTLLEYDAKRWLGGHIGYRIRNRFIELKDGDFVDQTFFPTLPNRGACVGQPLVNGVCRVVSNTSDSEEFEINEHSGLFGFWLRPGDKFRISFDMELMSADNAFTRISPRKRQDYWIRGSYRPKDWITLSSSVTLNERSNDQIDINNSQHNRTWNANVNIARSDKFGFDLGYTFQDVFSRSDICFVSTPVAPLATTSCGTPFLRTTSFYYFDDNFLDFNVYWKPMPKLRTNLGYAVTSTSGFTTILNPIQPLGPLAVNWHQPQGGFEYDFTPNWMGHFNWNHYGYNEKSDPGIVLPRDMRGNVFTISVRFSTGAR
jgi:hypothetical protein